MMNHPAMGVLPFMDTLETRMIFPWENFPWDENIRKFWEKFEEILMKVLIDEWGFKKGSHDF